MPRDSEQQPPAANTPEADPTRQRRRVSRRVAFGLVYLLFLLVLAELGARLFWRVRGAGFFTAQRTIYRSFYPGVARVERESGDESNDCFDILMLGGSVLHSGYGDIEHVLRERLIRRTGQCVHIHNLAEPGHTSLDSLYKYRHLQDHPFDLIVVYHGINEVRANNCEASVFRKDYGHFSWYKLINDFEQDADSRWFVLPYTVEFVGVKLIDRLGWSDRLPTHRPDAASLDFGCDVKTGASLRANLRGILELADRRRSKGPGPRVVLMSFAFYLPANYTEQAFDQRTLDYTAHTFPVELWGKPACVEAALSAHNRVVKELSQQFERVLFVDQNALIPKRALYFNDICHLTHEGCERFAENLLPVVLPLLR